MNHGSVGLPHMAMISSLGTHLDEVWQHWAYGEQDHYLSSWASALNPERDWLTGQVRASLPAIGPEYQRLASRCTAMLEHCIQQLLDPIEALIEQYGRDRMAVIIGSSTSGISQGEQAWRHQQQHPDFPPGYHYDQQALSSPAHYIQQRLRLSGPCYTLSTACSSSGKAFATAQRLILNGIVDVALVGGADELCDLTTQGFHALASVSDHPCQPFGAEREGINIGEGAALFVMTKTQAEVNLQGVGESSDAHHMSAPDPSGAGALEAMHQALKIAALSPSELGYVNLHGTGTPLNDAMESLAFRTLFAEHTSSVCCSATKRLTGHTLGASGALELALCWLLLKTDYNREGIIPPMRGDYALDEMLQPLPLVWQTARVLSTPTILSNSFAFGGSNVAVCIGRHD
ncbi:beta-ketoacyl-[acyl-carrier-protein] synthase II [Terasakiispira papahanaumokuakeensis]|uniref:Beta-ketoacyl-[acyl-carrier-protein] synthase II n=1 Tax=Terasakiispira papahanaumokuakeensis TaxID=197479 RepID=A0A1E2VBW3_9GAMM|nr:beta-ketoacyl-ACP synthase [Terasakiispira papahanaumokuakeensis]ODC04471.1 beta-ketoacyl-[acyl-carrier-protein] synthase II [Terasakiispira papahanaumokuakeensis]